MSTCVLITGCSTGIGAALARELHQRGCVVYATARRPDSLASLAKEGLRTLTLDVNDDASIAAALGEASDDLESEGARLRALADRLVAGIRAAIPAAELIGDPVGRVPGNVHVLFPGAAGESMLFLLDQAGISVSIGSACQAGVAEPSHVVLALGRDERAARSVLRMTLGATSTDADVDAVLAALPEAYARASGSRTADRS